MRSRSIPKGGLALLLLLLGTGAFPGTLLGQTSTAPTKLWEFNPAGQGAVTDIAIDATGKVLAAVYSDGGPVNFEDHEVFVWDLARDETSSDPILQDDPRPAITAPEGLGVVALAPMPTGKADLLAVGREGASGQNAENRLYGYQVSRGVASREEGTMGIVTPAATAVRDLWFNDDGSKLLVWQEGKLVLYTKGTGAKYTAIATKNFANEVFVDIAVAPDLAAILISTTQASAVNPDVHRLRLIGIDDDTFEDRASVAQRTTDDEGGVFETVDVSADGEYVVAGSADRIVWYYRIIDDTGVGDADSLDDFSTPWSDQVGGSVTAVGISSDGLTFAAGFESQGLWVYRQTSDEPDGPLAQRAIKAAVATSGPATDIEFTNQDNTLFVASGVVNSFSAIQFDPRDELVPLWQVPGGGSFAVSRDGNRFAIGAGEKVVAYKQRYAATVSFTDHDAATPGETLTVDLSVANTGSAFDEYQLTTTGVPASWIVDLDPDRLNLLPGESMDVTFNVTPPAGEGPSVIALNVRVGSRFNPDAPEAALKPVPVTVREVHGADLEIEDDSIDVTRGQKARVEVTVLNTGNVRDTVLLEVSQRTAWPVTISGASGSSKSFDIGAGASTTTTVEFDVPSGATQGSTNAVTLRARPQGGGSQAEETLSLAVEPDYGATLAGPTAALGGKLGDEVEFEVTLHNTGNTRDTFSLRAYSNATNTAHFWEARLSHTSVELGADADRTITVTVSVPRGAEASEATDITVVARSAASGLKEAESKFRVQVSDDSDDSPFPLFVVPLALALVALGARRRAR